MRALVLSCALAAASCAGVVHSGAADAWQVVSTNRIWDAARHNAFTDLARFGDRWFCTFREGERHVVGDGTIRVLVSSDGQRWESGASLSEPGVDLRDPKLCVTPDGRLMLVIGGSVYEGRTFKERQTRVAFSRDGTNWSAPQRVLEKGDWLWRVTWHRDRAYGIAYRSENESAPETKGATWSVKLVESEDGITYRLVTGLEVSGRPNEGTLRFLPNHDCVALLRREGAPGTDSQAWIGVSSPPYKDWRWQPAGMPIGGPNFLVLPDGKMLASGRQYNPAPTGAKTFVGPMTFDNVTPELILPSGGDCSYPGMVWHDGTLWLSYYSSHEGKANIYLARLKMAP